MRSQTARTVQGKVLATGAVQLGPLSCRKEAQGRYRLFAPAGSKILSINVTGDTFPQWAFAQLNAFQSGSVLVIFANQAATVEVDAPFRYIVTLSA